jgi:hypothetical protein
LSQKALTTFATVGIVLAVGLCGFVLLRDDTVAKKPAPAPTLPTTTQPTRKIELDAPQGQGGTTATTDPGKKAGPAPVRPVQQTPGKVESAIPTQKGKDGQRPVVVVAGAGGGPIVVVRGPDNRPVAGAIVEASAGARSFTPRPTNQLGEAALDPIPADAGTVTGTVRHPRFSPPATFTCDPGTQRVEVKFTGGETGTLTGSIRDSKGRAPQVVQLLVKEDGAPETSVGSDSFAVWDGNGNFKVDLAPARYSVRAQADSYVNSDYAYPTVVAGQETAPISLLLESACAIVGRVNLPPELQASRDPVQLIFDLQCIRGTKENPNTTTTSQTLQVGTDGSYRIDSLQPGDYRVRVSDGQRVGAWRAARLAEGTTSNVDLPLDGAPAIQPIRGVIRDSRGGLVQGAQVTTPLVSFTTDASGAFELRGLDPGPVDIVVAKDGYVGQTTSIVVPQVGQPPLPDIVIVLNQRGSATGTVTQHGKPAAGIKVLVFQKQEGGPVKPYPATSTDATGSWRVDGLDAGTYYVKAGTNPNPFDVSGAPVFVVQPGETVQAPALDVP